AMAAPMRAPLPVSRATRGWSTASSALRMAFSRQFRDGLDAQFAQTRPHRGAAPSIREGPARVDAGGRLSRLAQALRLRVGPRFQARSAARVGLAGEQEALEALGPAEGVSVFQEVEHLR